MQGGSLSTQNFSINFNKVNWPTFTNSPSYIAAIHSIEARSKHHSNRCNVTVLEQNVSIYFPPFSLISRILKKVHQEKVEQMMIVTPTLLTQPCYPLLLKMSLQCLLLLTPLSDLLLDPQGNKHPLVQNRKLMLAAWKVTENPLRWKEFQAMQPNLYPSQEEMVLSQVTNRPGISGLAGELGKKLVHFVHL